MAARRSRKKSSRKAKTSSVRRKKGVHVSPRKVKAARRAVKRAEAHLSSLEKQSRRRKR